MTATNPMTLLHSIMPGWPRAAGMRADGEIIARTEAMQAGDTFGVAKIEVFSKNEGARSGSSPRAPPICLRHSDPFSTPICR